MADVERLGVEGGQQPVTDHGVENGRGVLVRFEAAYVNGSVPAAVARQRGDALDGLVVGGLGAAGGPQLDAAAVAEKAHADPSVVGAVEAHDAVDDQLIDLPVASAEGAGEGFGGGVEC